MVPSLVFIYFFELLASRCARVPSLQKPEYHLFTQTQQPQLDDVRSPNVSHREIAQAVQAVGYFPDWLGDTFSPDNILWSQYDAIYFAFALPNEDFSITWDDDNGPNLLRRLVLSGHAAKKLVGVSIGGWTGSSHFSKGVSSSRSRQTLVKNIVDLQGEYNVDIIDIDWEYPGRRGMTDDFSSDDSRNFLVFLQLLRSSLPGTILITAAVSPTPLTGSDGNPMKDLLSFAKYLNFVTLMVYDIFEASPNPGPNAPLYDACGNATQPYGSVAAAYAAWILSGFPPGQLMLGLPAYGTLSASSTTSLASRGGDSNQLLIGRTSTALDDSESQVQFSILLEKGALIKTETGSFVGSSGFKRYWDDCSKTPFLVSSGSNQLVSYDDVVSITLKVAFAKAAGMKGFSFWDISGDTTEGDLVKAARQFL